MGSKFLALNYFSYLFAAPEEVRAEEMRSAGLDPSPPKPQVAPLIATQPNQ
jgi:hypothetical protein